MKYKHDFYFQLFCLNKFSGLLAIGIVTCLVNQCRITSKEKTRQPVIENVVDI